MFVCVILFACLTSVFGIDQRSLIDGLLFNATRIAACRTTCLEKFVGDGSSPPFISDHPCYEITECGFCWFLCTAFTVADRQMLANGKGYRCGTGCKTAKRFVLNSPLNDSLEYDEEIVKLELRPTATSVTLDSSLDYHGLLKDRHPEGVLIYSLLVEEHLQWRLYDQSTKPSFKVHFRLPVHVEMIASVNTTIAGRGRMEYRPNFDEDNIPTNLSNEEKLLNPRILPEDEFLPTYNTNARSLRHYEKTQIKGFHWNLKADEMRRTASGMVEVILKWNPFPASGTYTVTVSSFSKQTSFKALDKAAIFTVIPGDVYTVHVEFKSRRNHLVTLSSPSLIIDTTNNEIKQLPLLTTTPRSTFVRQKEDGIYNVSFIWVCFGFIAILVAIFVFANLFIIFKYKKLQFKYFTTKHRAAKAAKAASMTENILMQMMPPQSPEVETVEMAYNNSLAGDMKTKKERPHRLDLSRIRDLEDESTPLSQPLNSRRGLTFAVQLTPVTEENFTFPAHPPVSRKSSYP